MREDKREILEFLIEPQARGQADRRLRRAGQGQHAAQLLRRRRDFLDYTVDLNPHKQGHFLPGTHIPIRAPTRIREDRPDYVLILPWNLKDEIIEQLALHPRVGRALRGADAGARAAP